MNLCVSHTITMKVLTALGSNHDDKVKKWRDDLMKDVNCPSNNSNGDEVEKMDTQETTINIQVYIFSVNLNSNTVHLSCYTRFIIC